ncbi:MAG TPA: hypothetical protein VK968_14290 [Roseimicrobium sp.]|nr:hypothetical protein [Roseimicrobium sp.]
MEWTLNIGLCLGLAAVTYLACRALTRKPGLAEHRWRFFVTLLAFETVIFILVRGSLGLGLILFIGLIPVTALLLAPTLSLVLAHGVTSTILDGAAPPIVPLDLPQVGRWRKKGRTAEAIAHLKDVLNATPEDFGAYFQLAAIYAEDLNDYPEADRLVKLLLTKKTITDNNKLMALQKLEEWKAASTGGSARRESLLIEETAVRKAGFGQSTADSATATANLSSVNALSASGRYGAAVEMLEVLLKEKPSDLHLLTAKARLYLVKLKQPGQAEKIVRRILDGPEIREGDAQCVMDLARECSGQRDQRRNAELLAQKLFQSSVIPPERRIAALDLLKECQRSGG